jgi:hypothetical protein
VALTDFFLSPDEGLSLVIICSDVCIDVLLELIEACEGGAAKRLPLQDREPDLDLVEPGRACRREMKLHIGMGRVSLRSKAVTAYPALATDAALG